MALTAANVRVAVTGGVYRGPEDATLPTDATSSLDGALIEQGYASSDGITQSIGADSTEIQAWQNGDNVRTVQTSHNLTYAMSLLETSAATLETYYGNYTAGTVEITSDQGVRGAWVIHVVDGDHRIRIVIPDGQVTERGDTSFVNGDAIMYPITITCYPDENGVKAYLYLADTGDAS
jgi:hypothetical protein